MPDTCAANAICVGGVVAARNTIHPVFHSAEVKCPMTNTYQLAKVIDEILPYGSIMADESEFDVRSRANIARLPMHKR